MRFFLFLLFPLTAGLIQAGGGLEIQLTRLFEIGRGDVVFSSIASVCEDENMNFYVLDRLEHRVYRFSGEGKLLRAFGQKGQGPGDFQNPHWLTCTPSGQLVVADELYDLSFFTPEGAFIKRVHLDGRLGVAFVGEDRFYAWVWGLKDRSQVVVDGQNRVLERFFRVPKKMFSVSAPDATGRLVMFQYVSPAYVPSLHFAQSGRYSAVGVSDRYEIAILDEKGKPSGRLQRDVKAEPFTKRERRFLEEEVRRFGEQKGWPKKVIRDLTRKIPKRKVFFDGILMTESRVFVFRIPHDITREKADVPVDIFSINGKFLGTATLERKPVHISDRHMYFVRTSSEDRVLCEKAIYKIRSK